MDWDFELVAGPLRTTTSPLNWTRTPLGSTGAVVIPTLPCVSTNGP